MRYGFFINKGFVLIVLPIAYHFVDINKTRIDIGSTHNQTHKNKLEVFQSATKAI